MYRTEIYGKQVVYTNECIIYGNLDIYYSEMHDIQHVEERHAFKFTYQGITIEIPYHEGERDVIMPYYRMAAAASPKPDPIESDTIGAHSYEQSNDTTGKASYGTSYYQAGGAGQGFSGSNGGSTGYYGSQNANNSAAGFSTYNDGYRTFEKNIFTWVFCFLLGGFGVDRFVRGQIGVGVCKLLFGWMTIGIWALVDWIIALVKAYGAAFGNETDFVFDEKGHYIR